MPKTDYVDIVLVIALNSNTVIDCRDQSDVKASQTCVKVIGLYIT